MSEISFDFDLIVVGAGYGGFDAAKHAAEAGLKVAIVESRDMGGTCVNRGCVPSKALLLPVVKFVSLQMFLILLNLGYIRLRLDLNVKK